MISFSDSTLAELRMFLTSSRVDESGNRTPVTSPWRFSSAVFADPTERTTIDIRLRGDSERELQVILSAADFDHVDEVPNTSRLSDEAFRISILLEEQVFSYTPDQLGPVITLH